jgi:hypothetical protein
LYASKQLSLSCVRSKTGAGENKEKHDEDKQESRSGGGNDVCDNEHWRNGAVRSNSVPNTQSPTSARRIKVCSGRVAGLSWPLLLMSQAELLFAYVGLALQLGLLLILMGRASYRRFPAFCVLTVLSISITIALLAVSSTQAAYRWIYWGSDLVNTLGVFFSLLEVFKIVFKNFYRMPWFRMLFPSVGMLMGVVAILRSLFRPTSVGSQPYVDIIVSLEIGVEFLQMGIFTLFLFLGKFFRVRYERHPFGIVLGFGLISAGWLVVYLLRSEFGTRFDPVVRIAPAIAYTLGLLIWLATFLVKEPAPAQSGVTTGLTPELMISDVKRYTEAAKRIFRQ